MSAENHLALLGHLELEKAQAPSALASHRHVIHMYHSAKTKAVFSEARIDHFVMAITSAEASVWHTVGTLNLSRWENEHGRAFVCADCCDQAVAHRCEAERATIARPRLGERKQVAGC